MTTILEAMKELDAAVSSEATASELEEQYPDADPQSIETAKQIETLHHRIEALEDAVEQKRAAKANQLLELRDDLERKTAVLAYNAGVATEGEKQLVKEAAADNQGETEPESLAAYFDPATNHTQN